MNEKRFRSTPPPSFSRLIDVDDLPIGLIDIELSMSPAELIGDTAVLMLNQVRVNMKAMGNFTVYEQPGGQGLRHAQTVTVQMESERLRNSLRQ